MSEDLATLQRQLLDRIRLGDEASGPPIAETAAMPRALRFAIYADAYLLRLEEALRSNFPKLHQLLGDEDFSALTRAYVTAEPSRQRSIRWFGRQLADFLATRPPYARLPLLAELARFEWTLGLTFDAADATALPLSVLTELDDDAWPLLRPRFHPAFAQLDHHWNSVAVWQALDEGKTPPGPDSLRLSWQCWRDGLLPRYRSQAPDEAALCRALLAGQAFGVACTTLLDYHPEATAPAVAAGSLGRWLAEGVVIGLDAGSAE
ncbi:HvfC/BufC N-terminal domain-containing protein [Chitinimonas lacunae]|uniref:DUF2063 domain-containing protein n=1 Tax=Chitinimonas lacunae TaxID=1963018 RepID=A0ABV8MS55_9NEIS